MSTLNRIYSGRIGFESRNLSRRTHRFDLHADPLEPRRLLSGGQAAGAASATPSPAAETDITTTSTLSGALSGSAISTPPPVNTAAPVVSSTTGIPSLPTNNSSTTNSAGVSPMDPAPLDTATDGSTSVLTTPSSAISALIPKPNTLGFTSFTGEPVFIVPMADSDISELSIETGELQATNAPAAPQMSLSPMIPHPINAPVSAQANSSAVAAQNQPATVIPTQHIGQGRETELQKQVKPQLGPQPDEDQQGIDVVVPPQAPKPADAGSGKTTPPQAEHPKTQQPKIEQPKTDQPTDGTKRPKEAPPAQDTQPMWWWPAVPLPVPISPSVERKVERAADNTLWAHIPANSSDGQVLPALFGAVGVAGGLHLAMAESRRFGVHWLPSRVASSRSARPRVGG
jgi:hypothetical protein